MPRLPSSQDVPVATPARDPGVNVPEQAFQSSLGLAAGEFSQVAQVFGEIAVQQKRRRDAIDRAKWNNTFNREAEQELRRLQVDADLKDEEVLAGFGTFLNSRRQQILEQHGGFPESRARLEQRLMDIENAAIGRAAAVSTRLGREEIQTAFQDSLSPTMARASRLDTDINQVLLEVGPLLEELDDVVPANEREAIRRATEEQIALTRINALVGRGRIEEASEFLETGGLQSLTPKIQIEQRQRISDMRFAMSETMRNIQEAESELGRPLTQEETLQAFNLAPRQPLVTVSQGETARAKAEGEAIANIQIEQLPSIRRQLSQVAAMENLLERGVETGGLRQLRLQAANFFGVDPETFGTGADLAAFQAIANSATLTKSTELAGAISERELEFIQNAVASASAGTEANKAVLRIQGKLLQREHDALRLMERYFTARGTLAGFEDFLADWARQNPLFEKGEEQEIRKQITAPPETEEPRGQDIPTITTQEQYDALPVGAKYLGPDGRQRTKGSR